MKTFALDIVSRLKRINDGLDFKAFICNKSWWLFSDDNIKTSYLFQEDGIVFITKDGIGIKNKWSYVPATNSLIIDSQDSILMLHPSFIDSIILVLMLDGTKSMAFLIDENNRGDFYPHSLEELKSYFLSKYKREIEAVRTAEEKAAAEYAKRIAEEEKNAEIMRREAELDRIPVEERKKRAREIKSMIENNYVGRKNFIVILFVLLIVFIASTFVSYKNGIGANVIAPLLLCCFVNSIVLIIFLINRAADIVQDIRDFKDKNPFDPGVKYLD